MTAHAGGEGWERAFWHAFESSSTAIALVDEQRRFVEVNEAMLAILGGSRDEILGASVTDAIPSTRQALAQHEWDGFLRSGDYSGGGPIVRLDGSEAEIEVAACLTAVGGRRLAVCAVTSASASWPPINPSAGPAGLLTEREREVVTLIALGRTAPQVAEELFISPATVRTHVHNAMQKLGVHTQAHLVATVLSRGDTLHPTRLEDKPSRALAAD